MGNLELLQHASRRELANEGFDEAKHPRDELGQFAKVADASEKIVRVASRSLNTGKIYYGAFHGEAADRAATEDSEYDLEHGFETTTGRFVTRDEAVEIASRHAQLHKRAMREVSEGKLTKLDTIHVKQFATA